MSRFLAAHTEPSDRVLVWGSVPEIYWASGALPASRLIPTNTFLAGNHPGRPPEDAAPEESDPEVWDWFFQDLTRHPPRYIVDTAPAEVRSADRTPMDDFPRLDRYVDQHYRLVRTIDGFNIYERT